VEAISYGPGASDVPGRVFKWGRNINSRYVKIPTEAASMGAVKQIASGSAHVLALTHDGRVIAWGANASGQLPDVSGIEAVAAGYSHSLVLFSNGTVGCFGDNTEGQCNVPLSRGGEHLVAQRITASKDMSFAQLPNGSWVYWGKHMTVSYGDQGSRERGWRLPSGEASRVLRALPALTPGYGQSPSGSVGGNRTTNSSSYASYALNVTIVTLNVDEASFLMLDSTTGRLLNRYSPHQIPSSVQEADISSVCTWQGAGAAAASDDGRVWSWSYVGGEFPAPAKAQGRTRSVTCGHNLFIAILDDGDVAAWGPMVDAGVLPPLPQPSELLAGGGVVSAAAGNDFVVLLLANGTAMPVGQPAEISAAPLPEALETLGAGSPSVTAMFGGSDHAVAALSDGQLLAFGNPWVTAVPQAVRDAAVASNGTLKMASGSDHMLALLPDGSIAQW
jgi:alpha-tubulin suppressor-like RCC1 family protein